MIKTDIHNFSYNPKNKTLAAEASDLGLSSFPDRIEVFNPHTGNARTFVRTSKMIGFENETTAWNYTDLACDVKLIIFND